MFGEKSPLFGLDTLKTVVFVTSYDNYDYFHSWLWVWVSSKIFAVSLIALKGFFGRSFDVLKLSKYVISLFMFY